MYLTEQEIMGTQEALMRSYEQIESQEQEIKRFFEENKSRKFVFIGCGSSNMLAKSCERLFIARPGTSAVALAGGDYLVNPGYYRETVRDAIVVALSRSGLTSEIVRGLTIMKKEPGVKVVSITMKEGNDAAGLSDLAIVLPWAYDNSVCQTRTVATLYASALQLCAICYGDEGLKAAVKAAAGSNKAHQEKWRPFLEEIGKNDFSDVVVLADGRLCGIAEEGALAFTEVALVPGKYFNMLDYRHGPIVLNGKKTLTILLLQPGETSYQYAMVEDLKKHGGTVVTVGDAAGNPCSAALHVQIEGIDRFEAFGMPFIYVCQMIALSHALAIGGNPDAPTGLDAYITLK